ncbi:unnamed protein product, partial [Ilex paraguariensis]
MLQSDNSAEGSSHEPNPNANVNRSEVSKLTQLTKFRDYTCSFCFKSFSTAQALGGHQNAHRSERTEERRLYIKDPIDYRNRAFLRSVKPLKVVPPPGVCYSKLSLQMVKPAAVLPEPEAETPPGLPPSTHLSHRPNSLYGHGESPSMVGPMAGNEVPYRGVHGYNRHDQPYLRQVYQKPVPSIDLNLVPKRKVEAVVGGGGGDGCIEVYYGESKPGVFNGGKDDH